MLVDAMRKIQNDAKLPIINTVIGPLLLKNDEYQLLIHDDKVSVTSKESFVTAVLGYAKRVEDKNGERVLIEHTANGAKCSIKRPVNRKPEHIGDYKNPYEGQSEVLITYSRKYSVFYEYLKDNLKKALTHLEFLEVLNGLKPVIVNADDVIPLLKRIRLDEAKTYESNPVFEAEDGEKGEVFKLLVTIGTTKENAKIPASITLKLPIIEGDCEADYKEINVDFDVYLDRGKIRFKMFCPELIGLRMGLKASEKAFIDKSLESLTEAITVSDY